MVEDNEPSSKRKATSAHLTCSVEVMCMLNDTPTIPRGDYKDELCEADLLQYLVYKKTDNEDVIHTKIIALFPSIFKTPEKTFIFVDASSKHLKKLFSPHTGFTEWNGGAINKLTGQGRLYILPLEEKVS